MLDSFGEFYKNRSSTCESQIVPKLRVRGQTCGLGEGADRGES